MMQATRQIMGMPVSIAIDEPTATMADLDPIFAYFIRVDATFSTYKATSEISRINRRELTPAAGSAAMRAVLALAEATKCATDGYFDIRRDDGQIDPSGIVKGWAIRNAADRLAQAGWRDYLVEAGGDMAIAGMKDGRPWRIGIRNPFKRDEHVKTLALMDCGIATSGTAIRGQHIYNPHRSREPIIDVVSLTVIGPDVLEADRFATAAFAMGRDGIHFIARQPGLDGYQIDSTGQATATPGFARYVIQP